MIKDHFDSDLRKLGDKKNDYCKIGKGFPTIDGFSIGNSQSELNDSKITMLFQITVSRTHDNNVTKDSFNLLKTLKSFDEKADKCRFIFVVPKSKLEFLNFFDLNIVYT